MLLDVQRTFDGRLRPLPPSVVTLFSGGVDSLCALLEAAMQGERPLAVGHWSTDPHAARQRDLAAAAVGVGGWDFPLVGVEINRKGAERAESSQRSRAFLFATLGAVAAAESGIGRVYLADNGPISINLPINDQIAGALASRSTHPKFLHLYNELLSGLFPHPVRVTNPLAGRTRAEVMAVLPRAGCEHLLKRTLSCSAWSRLPASTPQCGVCSQCIDRRIAGIVAGLEEHDPASGYRTDALTADLSHWKAQTTAESYVRFYKRVRDLDNDALFREFPQLRDVVVPGDPDPDATMDAAFDLIKRHANMVRDGLRRALTDRIDLYLDGKLGPTSMLIVAGRELGGEVGVPVPAIRSAVGTAGVPANGASNAIVWIGGAWQMVYGGVPVTVDGLKGMPMIALLLAHPRKSYTAADIEAELGVVDPDLIAGEPTGAADGFAGQHRASGGTKIDYDAVKDYRAQIAGYDEDIAEAERAHDIERVAELKMAREFFVKQLRDGMKPGGALATFSNDLTKQHQRVSKSLRRTIAAIRREHKPLGDHLRDAIKRHSDFVYAPEPDVPWEVHPPAS